MPPRRKLRKKFLMISAVAELFEIHPQTLRLYEKEGLIRPARSSGNTRLYDEEAIRRLETILALTRELGINLAGVDVILNMREQIEDLQLEVNRLLQVIRRDQRDKKSGVDRRFALEKFESGPLSRRR